MSRTEEPDPQLGPDGLTEAEVGALWAFLHGDIMIGGIRERIREHWGLCSRHAWGHAVVEIELWEQGAGARGGHQPFDVGVLYDDLLTQMIGKLRGSARSPKHILARKGQCYVHQQLDASADVLEHQIGYAGFNSKPLTAEANKFEYTRGWLSETVDVWRPRICPVCVDGATGPRCRTHLITAGATDDDAHATATYLEEIRRDLGVLVNSMTEHGAPSNTTADASWISALGWFHTWNFPVAMV